ncbi:MAG: hypothetical protein Q4B28_01135 [bacterium]|nr:hypothetical protein [bacterium]
MSNIDTSLPICGQATLSPTTPTNNKVTITWANASDQGGSNLVAGQEKSCEVTENGQTCTVTLRDTAGNSQTCISPVVSNIDKTPLTASIVASTSQWTNQNVVLTLTTNKVLAEVPVGWQAVVGEDKKYTKTLTTNEQGNLSLRDVAGNTTNVSFDVGNIDKTAPSCGTNWTMHPDAQTPTKEPVTLTLAGSQDGESGLVGSQTLSCTVSEKGSTCVVSVADVAGNTASCTSPVVQHIDTIPPQVADIPDQS